LRFGVFPHLSGKLLLERYHPLVTYLEARLGRPIVVTSAPDFATFTRRVAEGRYDIYVTAPHLAAYHEKHQHDLRLVRYSEELYAMLIVASDAPIDDVAGLRGKTILVADRLAVTTMMVREILARHGVGLDALSVLAPGVTAPATASQARADTALLKDGKSHNNIVLAVADGRETAAMVASQAYLSVPEQQRNRTRVLAQAPSIPHVMYMARADLPSVDYRAIKEALLAFTPEGAGAVFFAAIKSRGFIPISDTDMRRLAPLEHFAEMELGK
jgi:phosphonate transport system substrate-binding protein